MKRTVLLQEIRKMRFDEAYEGWDSGRLTQGQAAELPGMCERSFRRYFGPNLSADAKAVLFQRVLANDAVEQVLDVQQHLAFVIVRLERAEQREK